MTDKEFSQALRLGLGSAILKLKNAGDNSKYRDIVLHCCLRDIAHDTQVEGTKGYYLYTAIKTFGDQEVFLDSIAEKFEKRLYWRLSEQLYDTLCCFSNDGHETAEDALEKKYNELKNRLPTMRSFRLDYCERELLERLMIRKLNNGFKEFKRCVNDIEEMVLKRGNSDCLWCDFFLDHAMEIFGEKRVNDFVDEMYEKSSAIKIVVDILKAEALSREEYQANLFSESVTIEVLLQNARESATSENPRSLMARFGYIFAKMASEADFLELAHIVLRENDETVKALLLMMFRRRPFPLDVTPLIEYAQSKNKLLSEISIDKLGYIKNKRLHDLAIHLLEENGLHSFALGLLKKNYRKADDNFIRKLIVKTTSVPQYIQSDIANIYLNHRSVDAYPILRHVYKNGECSHCRHRIVRAMNHCKVLTSEILEECLYDSYEDTRKYAQRISSRR